MDPQQLQQLDEQAEKSLVWAVHLANERRSAQATPDGREHPQDLARVERMLHERPEARNEYCEDDNGRETTLLHVAAGLNLPGICAVLLTHGAGVNRLDGSKRTPLLAVFDSDFDVAPAGMEQTVEVLVKNGADPSLGILLGESPSQIGVRLGGKIQQLLCSDPQNQDLNTAVTAGNVARVRELLATPDSLANSRQKQLIVDALRIKDEPRPRPSWRCY